jgi:hypothetical protein
MGIFKGGMAHQDLHHAHGTRLIAGGLLPLVLKMRDYKSRLLVNLYITNHLQPNTHLIYIDHFAIAVVEKIAQ